MSNLCTSNPFFVRCIKPNNNKVCVTHTTAYELIELSLSHFVLYLGLELMVLLFENAIRVWSHLLAKFKCGHLKHTPIRHAHYQMAILCMVVYLSMLSFSSDRRRLHIINSVWRYKTPLRDTHMLCTLFYSDCIGPEPFSRLSINSTADVRLHVCFVYVSSSLFSCWRSVLRF